VSLPRSDALVFFGATGDLAYKKIFPALQAMIKRGHLDIPVIGVAKAGWDLERLKQHARESLQENGGLDSDAFTRLTSLLRYVDGDYRDPATFSALRKTVDGVHRFLHYLAIPPSMFAAVAEGLAGADCVKDARVVVEKPFGRDLASARALSATLHRYFAEQDIFRIDHYLGKETVQNLLYFRFANPLLIAGWSKNHLESVQVTMAEDFGVAGRGKFYEEVGAIRDVVQNHMLQVVASLAMECPVGSDHESLRDERGKLLQSIKTLAPNDILRGQFRGYRGEPGVDPNSKVETFAALRFAIDNDRWTGVPFHVRVGKNLPVTVTEVMVKFKRPHRPVLDESGHMLANYYRFRLTPELVIAVGAKVKRPGEQMVGQRAELVAHYAQPDEMEPYERLLGDAIRGDATLFARGDAVESAWRILDQILGTGSPLYEYDPGSWGPTEADGPLAPEGGWNDPVASQASG